jgi:hypothetical protein
VSWSDVSSEIGMVALRRDSGMVALRRDSGYLLN